MSQSGKRFLSGLVNRVFSSNTESRATAKRRERSLSARRLGMEPLEDRQLLAVDPTLLSDVSQAEVSSQQLVESVDLSAVQDSTSVLTTTGVGSTISVSNATTKDSTTNTPSKDTAGTHLINADLNAEILDRLSCDQMTWAAALANALTYTGWSSTSIVDTELASKPEQQTLDYFTNSFTNDPSNVALAFAWFMEGSADYTLQGNEEWAQILPNCTNGGLFPSASGQYSESSAYCKEVLASEIASPLYGISVDYLDNNYGIVVEVHYNGSTGVDVETANEGQAKATWLTYWGYDYDSSYDPTDPEYFTAVYMSNPNTGKIERMTISWDNSLNSYVFTNFESNVSGQVPYIYSFTAIQRMPGYGVLTPDQYELNNATSDFEGVDVAADLGKIDVLVPSSTTGAAVYGNTFTLENLTLYADGVEATAATEAIPADPVDYYKFELTQNASHSDSIVVNYGSGYLSSKLKATLYVCGEDGEAYPIDPTEYGYVGDHFDAVSSEKTSYYVGEDGKTYSKVTNQIKIDTSGLTPGFYYLKVEFADDVVGGINSNYSITFNAGYDDDYESNDSYEEVSQLPVDTPSKPSANFGVLYGRKFVDDLVLKQYDYNVSETDWFRFEMTSVGKAGDAVNLYYNSTTDDVNDADLDFVLYKEDPNDPYGRGYTMVDRSWQVMTDVETVSLEGLDAGVYFIKVVGNLAAEDGVFVNVEYKLEILPGVDENLPPDLRAEVLSGNNWEGPLVLAVDRYVPSDSEQFKSESTVGLDGNVYLNYSFSVYGAQTAEKTATYENVQLGMFINGVRVEADDLREAILNSGLVESKTTQLLDLFCNGGTTMKAGESFEFLNFNIGKIADATSLAGKYFDVSVFAANSVVIVINPDNYEYGDSFGKVIDNYTVADVSLTYHNGRLYNGSTVQSVSKGETVKVFRKNVLVKTYAYGVDDFELVDGDVVVTEVVTHNYEVNMTDYAAKENVLGVLEYLVDNNFASTFFILDNLSEDVFAPNASVTEVMNNANAKNENPDLGVANIEYLDNNGVCHIDNLVITGKKDSNGSYVSDWFKFELLTGDEDKAAGITNYGDAYVEIAMDDEYSEVSDPGSVGDLDLYLYKVVQTDDTISFDEAFETGAYRLQLVASSKDITSTERIDFSQYEDIDDGTYFVCVSGFNGAANRYSLELGGFTHSGDIIPTDPSEYFTEDSVSILNSVATLNWKVPTTDYVSRAIISYRKAGTEEWTTVGEFKPSVTSCKIAGLDPDTEYEFKLTVTNFFVQDDPLSATVVKKTAAYLNEVVYRAIIVGVSDYPGASADLVAAANDANAFHDALLQDPQWAEENITVLLNDNATKANVLDAIASVGYVSDDNDVLLFYFAGSGTYAVTGGSTVGYLKTYGSTRSSYLSSTELANAVSAVAAGSKQFILDAGQVTSGMEETSINYDAFFNSLGKMTANGSSDRPAQVSVLTSGENGAVSKIGQGSRSIFSQVLIDGITFYSAEMSEEEAEKANEEIAEANVSDVTQHKAVESDGRVAFDELADYLNSDIRFTAYEMSSMFVTNTEEQTIMMNGYWSESEEFADKWLDAGAIVVTTTVDTVDDHDGKISLREAANLIGTKLDRATVLENGQIFTLGAGSVVTVGNYTGSLVSDVDLVYSGGVFKTNGSCSIEVGTKTVDYGKSGNTVVWSADNWNDGKVNLIDEDGLAVVDVTFNLRATIGSTIVDKAEYATTVDLEEGDVLYTSTTSGKTGVVTKVGQTYKVIVDGIAYNKTTGLYRKITNEKGEDVYESVTLSTYCDMNQDVEMTKIVFDESLAGQAITVNTDRGPIVFENGAVINATSLEGGLSFNGEGKNSLIRVSGTKLVSLIGVKIENSKGAAIIVDEGADFELANSLVYRNDCGSEGIIANSGNATLVNVTVANNTVEGNLISGTGTASAKNTIVALNNSIAGFTYDETCYVSATDNPGFIDEARDDYTLVKTSDAVDIGDNTCVNLRCGFVLDYDLNGEERYALGGTIDAGAFEYSVPAEDRETPSTVVTTLEDIVDSTDGEISLREAVSYAGSTYQIKTDLNEGDYIIDQDGVKYELKNGKLVTFEGVSGVQSGMYYTVAGVFMVDAYGESTALEEDEVITLANGVKATVVGTRLLYASGLPVDSGVGITREDGTGGTLSYGSVEDFTRSAQISVALTAAMIDSSTPVSTFDEGEYVLTYQSTGTFKATLKTTTTDSSNNTTTTEFEATFKLVAGTEFSFLDSDGVATETAKIATSRNVDLEDGKYTLVNDLTETIDGKSVTIYAAGAQLTLTNGVFTDADGYTVAVPKGTQLYSASKSLVVYQASNFKAASLVEGDEVTGSDGKIKRVAADGLSLYEEVTLGKVITFAKGLEGGTITLDRGAITLERAVTIDATLNGGLTIDALNADRAFNVNTYRESSSNATANLSGMTLINGSATEGGLIYVAEGSNLKLTDSTLSNGSATYGGAIYNAGKTTFEAISKATVITNTNAENGGAIYNVGSLTVTNAEINNAVASENGGAIYNAGTIGLAGAKINNSSASADGGALYNLGVASVSKSSEITGNTAVNGGAIYNGNVLNVVNSTIKNNEASAKGGAIYNAAGKTSLTNAKILGNSGVYGGAIYDAAQFFATRTVFAENTVGTNGAAVYTLGNATIVSSLVEANGLKSPSTGKYVLYAGSNGKITLVNDTVAGNKYGGVYGKNGSVTVYNSIVGDNNGRDLVQAANLDVQYSMIQNTTVNLDANNPEYAPNFKSYNADADWTTWSLMPASGSAAIDAGSVDLAYYYNFNGAKTALTVDFLGNTRMDGEGVEIGAYESAEVSETVSTVVTTLDDIVDPTDGLISLREAIRYASAGATVADRTVTFSSDLFPIVKSGTIYLDEDLQTIVVGASVVVTSQYTDEFGDTGYYDITIDGSKSNAPLFMFVDGADAELRGLTFASGRATGENASGGAFIIRGGSVSVVDSTFTGNVADRNGGAIYQTDGSLFIVNSLLYDNSASASRGYGGAICMSGGQAFIYNTTIAANDAAVYGGIFANDGLIVLANSIVAQNGGAQSVDVYATNIEATSNLIGAMDSWRSVNGLNGNIVGTPLNVMDPQFEDAANGDFHLQSGSLAVNSGVNAYAYGPDGVRLKYDLDANERIVGGVVDMGCFESGMADVPSTVVTTLQDVVDQEDGFISLREAISYAKQYGTPITFDLGEDYEGDSTIYLDGEAIDVTSNLVIDASNLPDGLTLVGSDDRIFNVYKSGSVLEDGTVTSEAGVLTLKNVALTGGEAARGGAIFMDGGELNFTNVLIYGNYAQEVGGAIYSTGGKITLLNSTVAGNNAENYQGVYCAGTISLQNSIIAGNATEMSAADYNYDLYVTGKLTSVASIVGATSTTLANEFNDHNGNTYGTVEAIVDPGFNAAESFDFTLKQDSIAINAGSNRLIGRPGYYASILQTASNTTVVRTDYAGNDRIVGGTVDIGAFEFQLATEAPSVVVNTLEDVVDPFDGKISLREAIQYAGSSYYLDGVMTRVGRTITFDPSLANGVIDLTETLVIDKCVTIDATDLEGSLTLNAGAEEGEEFNAVTLAGVADSVASEIWLCGLTITGGKATYGAGVYHSTGDATLINCVVYGNEGVYGAGIASVAKSSENSDNILSLINVTVTKNDSTGAYGGVWSIGSPMNISNTIIAKNTVNGEDGSDVSISSVGVLASSMIGISSEGFSRTYGNVENLIGTASSPYDPVFTDYVNNDFTLARDANGSISPAVNKGDNTLIALPDGSISATDAANNLRIIGGIVDIGAYESTMGPTEIPSTLVTTLDDVVDSRDGLISLREAISYANNYGLGDTITFATRLSGGTVYLNETLTLNNNITIDALANDTVGITLTTSDSVNDQRIIYVDGGDIKINGMTISNRNSERLQNGETLNIDQGGAVYLRSGSITFYNSLISDNAAKQGSAIYINEDSDLATLTLVNTTVVNNTPLDDATDCAAIYSPRGTLNLWNSIVAGNGDGQDVYKGAIRDTTDTVVVRGSTTDVEFDLIGEEVSFKDGDTITKYNSYNTGGKQEYTYQNGSFYYINKGSVISVALDGTYQGKEEYTVTYKGDGWYSGDVIFDLECEAGDTATLYDASTGTTSTLYFYNGKFHRDSAVGEVVAFKDGDQLTLQVTSYFEAGEDGKLYRRAYVQYGPVTYYWDGRISTSYRINPISKVEIAESILEKLRQELAQQTTYTKTVNGVDMTYQIDSANVAISELSASTDSVFELEFSYLANYSYYSKSGVSVFNSYVGLSDSLGSLVSGNGSFIGTAGNDLSAETNSMFVDIDNGDYRLTDNALATNGGNLKYLNVSSIDGTFTSKDILGQPRVFYKTIDMGAYENQTSKDSPVSSVEGTSITLTVTTRDDVVNPSDGVTSLREALTLANRLAERGYDNITIEAADDYTVRIDSSLGTLTVDVPVTINGNGLTIDADKSAAGLIVNTDGKVVLSDLIITNGVGGDGAGVKLLGGELVLNNCLIYNCEATVSGGAVYAADGATLSLYNTTLAKNVAVKGCGVYGDSGSTLNLYNSIVAQNTSSLAASIPTDVVADGEFLSYYSLIGNAGTASVATRFTDKSINSQIGYGVDNAIDPVFINASSGNFRLLATGSPARNAGSSGYVYSVDSVDLDGNELYESLSISMGAYQLRSETPSTIVTTAEDIVDPTDGLISLREALSYATDCVSGAGTGKLYNGVYGAVNAMNNSSVYSATYYSPITFDQSLAGQTIYLTSPLTLDRTGGTGTVYDYLIDGSSLSGYANGGVTIDCSRMKVDETSLGRTNAAFSIQGKADTTNGYYWSVALDIRNVKIVGGGESEINTAFSTNNWGMVTLRNCLVDGFRTCVRVADNDSDQAGVAHIYNSTLLGNIEVGGPIYMYNTILTGSANIHDTDNDPSYRYVYAYSSFIYSSGGLYRFGGDTTPSGQNVSDQFVDYENGNYHLASGSLCINRGSNAYVQTLMPTHAEAEVDIDGNPRIIGVVDMGCYETAGIYDIASVVVTTDQDVVDYADGVISLREAIKYAQQGLGGYTVTFSDDLASSTIVLTEPISITSDVKINGNGVTIDGAKTGSIFNVDIDNPQANVADFSLTNMTLTNGYTLTNGGAINISSGNVYLANLDIYGNYASKYGGAVYARDSELTIVDCRIGGNSATYYGGVVNEFGKTVLTRSYVAENTSIIANANADLWGRAAVNYVNSKSNVVGSVADNIKLYDGVDDNRVGTAESPIQPFVSAATGNLNVKSEWVIGGDTTTDDATEAVVDEAFALFAEDGLDVDLDDDLNGFFDDLDLF